MGATESWVYVREDGAIVLRTENDGPTFLRRGPEARDKLLLSELERRHPRLAGEAKKQLALFVEENKAPF
jgi:hypothetical protein